MARLDGRVALVTGGGRGLGRAYALRLASLGADVVVSDIDLQSAREFGEELTAATVIDEITALKRRAIGIEADVTADDQVAAMVDRVMADLGRLDILVCNAGGLLENSDQSYAASVSEDDLRATIDRNLYGTVFCCQAASRVMRDNGWGKIITVSSVNGLRGMAGGWYASYGVAKAGIVAYTWYLAEELGPFGITVNCIAPGRISTARMMARVSDIGAYNESAQSVPMRRWGTVEDCANAVEFLSTELSDYVTGQVLIVDGGLSIGLELKGVQSCR